MKKLLFLIVGTFALSSLAGNKMPKLENGTLYVFFGKHKCAVTSGVSSYKNAQHPKDAARGYYEKGGDLYILNDLSGQYSTCPKKSVYAKVRPLVYGIKEYSTVPGKNSRIVNFTLASNGHLIAWGYNKPVFDLTLITDYAHGCFNQKGKSFSSILAFAIDTYGFIYKIRGNGYERHQGQTYGSIKQFKKAHNVCK